MPSQKVLITGITGFIGSHIAERLLQLKYNVIGLKRKGSDCWRCNDFISEILWINAEDDFEQLLINLRPEIIIHCAWEGADAGKRDDADVQRKNIGLLNKLLETALVIGPHKFIALGSQAEYGYLDRPVSEKRNTDPHTEYGKVKVETAEILKRWGDRHNINWYWLRLFSFYGPKESENWLIPFVIRSFINNKEKIPLSDCTQKYAYLYIDNLVDYIVLLLENENALKGIYNISGSKAYELKKVILKIKDQFKNSVTELQFGQMPMRENQSIVLKGKMKKFHTHIGRIKQMSLREGIKLTAGYYKNEV